MAIIAAGPGLKAAAISSLRTVVFLRTWELQLSAEALKQLFQQFILFSPPEKDIVIIAMILGRRKPKPLEGEELSQV